MGNHCFTLSDADLVEYLRNHADLREAQGAFSGQIAIALQNIDRLCAEMDRIRVEQAKLRDEMHALDNQIRDQIHALDKLLARYIGIAVGVSSVVSIVVGAIISYAVGVLT